MCMHLCTALAEALTAPFALRLLRLVPHFRPSARPSPSELARRHYPRLHRWLEQACQRPSVCTSHHHELVVKIYQPSVPNWTGAALLRRRGRKKRAKAALNNLFAKSMFKHRDACAHTIANTSTLTCTCILTCTHTYIHTYIHR